MFSTISKEVRQIMELQLFFSIAVLVMGVKLLPQIGVSNSSIDIFIILTLGNYFYVFMFVGILVLLYFDDRKSAITVSSIFLVSNIIFTLITLPLGEAYYGFGFFFSSLLGFVFSQIRYENYRKNVNYYIFCSQYSILNGKKGYFHEISNLYTSFIKRK